MQSACLYTKDTGLDRVEYNKQKAEDHLKITDYRNRLDNENLSQEERQELLAKFLELQADFEKKYA